MTCHALIEPLEGRRLLHASPAAAPPPAPSALPVEPPAVPVDPLPADELTFSARVRFGPADAPPVEGYALDSGAAFADRGNGLAYGWESDAAAKLKTRHSSLATDPRYDSFAAPRPGSAWEIAVPTGTYVVRLSVGDPKARRGAYSVNVEDQAALRGVGSPQHRWVEATALVTVSDGRLTLTAGGARFRNKINFVDIAAAPVSQMPQIVNWRQGASSPITRAEAIGAAVGGRLFVFGGIHGRGRDFSFPVTARSDAYDPALNRWMRLRDMPEAFTHANAAVDGTNIWFAGGYVGHTPGPGSAHVWKYDTLTDRWSRGPDLPEPRGSGAAAVVGRNLHFFGGGGADRKTDQLTHWSLDLDDPNAAWVRRADLPAGRNHFAAATVRGKIYAVGGQTGDLELARDEEEVFAYDPATDTWAQVASLPRPLSHTNSSTLELAGRLVVIGGESGTGGVRSEVLAYDPATNEWTTIAELPDARSTTVAGIIGGQLVLSTGNTPGTSATTWVGTLRFA
jgi:N-acetylneuraminic acid mutarotase